MRKNRILLIMIIAILLSGCIGEVDGKGGKNQDNGITIVAFNQPIKSIAENIVGDKGSVYVLVETDPHTFQLTPKKAELLENADIYIGVSRELESFSIKPKKSIYLEDFADSVIEEENGEINPHYWMNPLIMKEMAKKVNEYVSKIDKKNKEYYEKNFANVSEELDKVDNKIREMFSDKTRKEYVITHPSTAYFDKEYGLKSYYLFIEGTSSPKRLEEIINKLKNQEVQLIVREAQFPEDKIRFLTEKLDESEIRYKVVSIDVLGIEEKDYIKMIEKDAEMIAENI